MSSDLPVGQACRQASSIWATLLFSEIGMRIFRTYQCDEGHHWIVQRQDTENAQPSDSICPDGHPAVTCRVESPVDDVQILISPAARVTDRLTGQRILDGRYYLSLLDKDGREICMSKEHYDWDTIVKLAAFFRKKAIDFALAWWKKRDL
jgi:hypothetical protein